MENGKLLKITLVLIMTITLLVMATNVFAADGDYTLDLTNTVNTNIPTTNTNTPTTNTNTPTYNTTVPTTNNTNTSLPSTGIAENTMLIVALVVLTITAIYAYSKFKYYKSI